MLGVKVDAKSAKEYGLVALAYLLVSAAFFWPLLAQMTTLVPGTGGDAFQSLWELWWVPYSIFTLHASPYATSLIFYPVGANLATQTFAPISGLASALIQWAGLAFSLNVLFFVGFVLAGLFAYLLAFHLTRNRLASFLAGFIFAFSPIHTIQAFGHLQYINIAFIPLFLLFFIRMLEEGGRYTDAILAGASFVLLTFAGDIEQALMTMVVAFLILVYTLLRKEGRARLLDLNFFRPKAGTETAAMLQKDYKRRIAEFRRTSASLNTDLRLMGEHVQEEADFAKKHEAEAQALRYAKPEERAELEEMHRNEERKMMEDHEREERLMLEGKPLPVRRNFLMLFAVMVLTALILASPFIIGIAGSLNASTLSSVNAQGSTEYNVLYSPDLLSFFIPSTMNGLLGFFSGAFSSINAPAASERTVYAGYTVMALALVGLYCAFKDKFKHAGIVLFPLAFLLLLSIGPYLQVGGTILGYNYTTGSGGIPGLYLAYHQIPLFNVLREPGRFDIVAELFLALLAAFGFAKVERVLAGAGQSFAKDRKLLLFSAVLLLLVLEYNTWPLSQSAFNAQYTNATIPKAYYELGNITVKTQSGASVPANFTVLSLPALSNQSGVAPELYPGMALYYQTASRKPLVGGYATRNNASQIFSLVDIPLVDSASYLESKEGLIYASPIEANATDTTLLLLGAFNVSFITLNVRAYNQTQLDLITSYLVDVFGQPVYNDNSTTMVFSTANAIRSYAGKGIVAYTPVLMGSTYSLWQPGWVLCKSTLSCNSTVQGTWFAVDPTYINIYSPDAAELQMDMRALSPVGSKSLSIYLDDQRLATLNLTSSLANYTVNLTVSRGLNQLVLISQASNTTEYSNVGVWNMTFKKYT